MTAFLKGLDHMQITAPKGSADQVRHFFVEVLQCQEVEKPNSMSHFDALWFDIGYQIIHVGLDEKFFPEKRGHPAFEVKDLQALMNQFDAYGLDYQEDKNMPGARRFYTYEFFGHRMEFLEWLNKPSAIMGSLEKRKESEY